MTFLDSSGDGSTLPRGHRDWHLLRRAAAGGLAGALLGPAAVGVSSVRALVAVFQSPCHSCHPLQRFLFMHSVLGCDGD